VKRTLGKIGVGNVFETAIQKITGFSTDATAYHEDGQRTDRLGDQTVQRLKRNSEAAIPQVAGQGIFGVVKVPTIGIRSVLRVKRHVL
jgi:hypothetical protein